MEHTGDCKFPYVSKEKKVAESQTRATFREKINQGVLDFTDEFIKEAENYRKCVATLEEYKETAQEMRSNLFESALFKMVRNSVLPIQKEISNEEMAAVIRENIEKIRQKNGAFEDYKREKRLFHYPLPQDEELEFWQYSDNKRFYEDYVNGDTYWREANAIYNAYAHYLADNFEKIVIHNVLEALYKQQDAIEEHLELMCKLSKRVSEDNQDMGFPMDFPFNIYKIAERIYEQLFKAQKSLEEQLYINHEQMRLLGKALVFAEEKGRDES